MIDGRRLYVNNLLSLTFYRLPTHFTTCCDQEVGTECVVSSDLAHQRKSRPQFLAVLDSLFGKKSLFFFLHREYLDPFFSEMFRPNGSLLTGRRQDRGDSSAALGNSGSTQMTVTWWVTQWGEGISRTVTRLSANTSPAAMEELASGTRSPFTWDIIELLAITYYFAIQYLGDFKN